MQSRKEGRFLFGFVFMYTVSENCPIYKTLPNFSTIMKLIPFLQNKVWIQIRAKVEVVGWTIYEGRLNPMDVLVFSETELQMHNLLREEIYSLPYERSTHGIRHKYGEYELLFPSKDRMVIHYHDNEFEYLSQEISPDQLYAQPQGVESKLLHRIWSRELDAVSAIDQQKDPRVQAPRELLMFMDQPYLSPFPEHALQVRLSFDYSNFMGIQLSSEEEHMSGWKLVIIKGFPILCSFAFYSQSGGNSVFEFLKLTEKGELRLIGFKEKVYESLE